MANTIKGTLLKEDPFVTELKKSDSKRDLENKVTHLLSEMLNDNAPIGEESYRPAAKKVIAEVLNHDIVSTTIKHKYSEMTAAERKKLIKKAISSADWDRINKKGKKDAKALSKIKKNRS